MADRGRLFYDSNGKLRQVDPAFAINGEPTESDLEPVEFVEILVDDLDIGDTTLGTVKELLETSIDSNHDYADFVQFTDGVSTSATTIISADSLLASGYTGLRATVVGREPDNPKLFCDVIHTVRGINPTTISSMGSGTPDARTYTESGPGNVQLAMAADTYNVVAMGDVVRVV